MSDSHWAGWTADLPKETASKQRVAHPVVRLLRTAFDDVEANGAAYVDWFAHLARVSRAMAGCTAANGESDSAVSAVVMETLPVTTSG